MVSLYRMMAEAGLQPAAPGYGEAAVFDPCAARADEDMQAAVRTLAERTGAHLTPLGEEGDCCGFGGHIQIPNPALFETISGQSAAASDQPYVVYCANCREVFHARGKDCRHILDFYFGAPEQAEPSLLEKRRNALTLKQTLLKEEWDMDYTPAANLWDALELTIPDALRSKLEAAFISESDLKETIWTAETGGDKLLSDDGWLLGSLVKPYVTYWAQYRPVSGSENAYELAAAYSHRMKWRE